MDDRSRARRLRHPVLGDEKTSVVWELYDFGVPVDLSPPPPDEVS